MRAYDLNKRILIDRQTVEIREGFPISTPIYANLEDKWKNRATQDPTPPPSLVDCDPQSQIN